MSITLLTGVAAIIGVYLLGKGAINTMNDWSASVFGKKTKRIVDRVYPEKKTTGYALLSTTFFLFDVLLTVGIPIAAGFILDPYSGPFLGAVIGILITIWRIKARRKYEIKLYTERNKK